MAVILLFFALVDGMVAAWRTAFAVNASAG